jgi:hypothetical protein
VGSGQGVAVMNDECRIFLLSSEHNYVPHCVFSFGLIAVLADTCLRLTL